MRLWELFSDLEPIMKAPAAKPVTTLESRLIVPAKKAPKKP